MCVFVGIIRIYYQNCNPCAIPAQHPNVQIMEIRYDLFIHINMFSRFICTLNILKLIHSLNILLLTCILFQIIEGYWIFHICSHREENVTISML